MSTLTGLRSLPEGYHLSHIQTGTGWKFRASKDGWKSSPSADVAIVVASAERHAAEGAIRRVAPATAANPAPARSPRPGASRACRGCGVLIPEGQGSVGSTGLFCGNCYID